MWLTPCIEPIASTISATRLGSPVARGELALLGAQDRHRRHVGKRRDHRVEQRQGRVLEALAGLGDALDLADGVAQLSLVRASRLAVEVRVAEVVLLHQLDQLARIVREGRPNRARHEGARSPRRRPGRTSPRRRERAPSPTTRCAISSTVAGLQLVVGQAVRLPKERARGERKRGVRPLGCAALRSVGHGEPVPHVAQKLFRGRRGRRLGPGPPDVHPGVVVRSADAGAAVGLDVDGGRHVQLASPGPVADLPDSEELRQPAPVARLQGLRDFEEGMRERARDPVLVEVRSARLDVERVALEELVVLRSDAVTEDVYRLGLAREPGGQLLGDEDVGPVASSRQPAIVSWSVRVKKSMPRRLASS